MKPLLRRRPVFCASVVLTTVLGGVAASMLIPSSRNLIAKASHNPQKAIDVLARDGLDGVLNQIDQQDYFFTVPAMAHSKAITCVDNRYLAALHDVRQTFECDNAVFTKTEYLAKRQIVENQLLKDLERERSLNKISGRPYAAPSVNVNRPDYEACLRVEVNRADFSSREARAQIAYWQINQYAEYLVNADRLSRSGFADESLRPTPGSGRVAHMLNPSISLDFSGMKIKKSLKKSQKESMQESLKNPKLLALATVLGEHGIGLGFREKLNSFLGAKVAEISLFSAETGMAPGFFVYNPKDPAPLDEWTEYKNNEKKEKEKQAGLFAENAMLEH